MNLVEYQTLSKRTMPFKGEPHNDQEFECMLGNYAMGLVGEITEALALINSPVSSEKELDELKQELGDISHYAVGLAAIAKIELPEHIDFYNNENSISDVEMTGWLVCEAGLIVEHAKKHIYHRHDFIATELDILEVLRLVKAIAKYHGFKYSEVLDVNIEKLKTRYPDEFSTADSIARKDVRG